MTLLKTVTATGSLNLADSGNLVGFAFANNTNSDAYIRNFNVENWQGGGGSDCSQYQQQISDAIEFINGSGS